MLVEHTPRRIRVHQKKIEQQDKLLANISPKFRHNTPKYSKQRYISVTNFD